MVQLHCAKRCHPYSFKADMKNSIHLFIRFIILFTFLSCTENKDAHLVKISLDVQAEKFTKIKISELNTLNAEEITLAMDELDSLGQSILEFPLDKHIFTTLKIGENSQELYLEPGYELNILIDTAGNPHYSGIGAEANTYLHEIFLVGTEKEKYEGKRILELEPEEFLSRLDTLEKALKQFHKNFFDNVNLPIRLTSLLESKNRMKVLAIKQTYQWNYGVQHDFIIPKALDMLNEIPYDSIILNSSMREYYTLIHFKWNIKRNLLFHKSGTLEEQIRSYNELPLIIKKEIVAGGHSSYMKDFLLAKNIDYWMALIGIGSPIDTMYSQFKREHANSPYLGLIEKRYQGFLATSPGQPAPQIKGISINGDSISLADFKNKVVYIDVWASWCGPCIAEIPFSQKLQNAFEGNDSIVFLNVSVDSEKDWNDALLEYSDWKGSHILSDFSIYKTYNIVGIPWYILIDKTGRIVTSDAPRPSSNELENQIRDLLR